MSTFLSVMAMLAYTAACIAAEANRQTISREKRDRAIDPATRKPKQNDEVQNSNNRPTI